MEYFSKVFSTNINIYLPPYQTQLYIKLKYSSTDHNS
jgi:hypothetical protein